MSEFTKLRGDMYIFSCLVFRSHEYSVANENLQPSTDAYKRVAYKKNECTRITRRPDKLEHSQISILEFHKTRVYGNHPFVVTVNLIFH